MSDDITIEDGEEQATEDENPGGETPETDVQHTLLDGADRLGGVLGLVFWTPFVIVARLLGTMLGMATNVIPFGAKLWAGIIKFSFYQLQKSSSADAVSLTHMPNGQIEPEPVKYVEPDKDGDAEDLKQKAGWKAKGRDKVWNPGAEGRGVERLGKANVILADEDAPQKASWVEANFAEALDLPGRVQGLYRDARVNVMQMQQGGAGQAMADGGVGVSTPGQYVSVEDPGMLEDALVTIGGGEGYDGTVVSARKVKEVYQEKLGSEQEQQAEMRGWLAGLVGNDTRGDAFKLLLLAGAIGLGIGYGEQIINAVFSSSGGGGGGGGGGAMSGILPGMVDVSSMAVGSVANHALTVLPAVV